MVRVRVWVRVRVIGMPYYARSGNFGLLDQVLQTCGLSGLRYMGPCHPSVFRTFGKLGFGL